MKEVFQLALTYGLVLSAVLNVMILGSLYLNPAIWADDAPPEIKARIGPMSEKTKRQRRLLMVPFFASLLVIMLAGLAQLRTLQGGDLTFWASLLFLYTMLMVFNLFDLLIIDWLIVETINPPFFRLPQLGELANVRHYGFHLRAFFIGSVGLLGMSVVVAALAALLF